MKRRPRLQLSEPDPGDGRPAGAAHPVHAELLERIRDPAARALYRWKLERGIERETFTGIEAEDDDR